MPAIASDRLVDLHNDLTHYDTVVSKEVREFLRGNTINLSYVDASGQTRKLTFMRVDDPGAGVGRGIQPDLRH